jgi:hypothetical protein
MKREASTDPSATNSESRTCILQRLYMQPQRGHGFFAQTWTKTLALQKPLHCMYPRNSADPSGVARGCTRELAYAFLFCSKHVSCFSEEARGVTVAQTNPLDVSSEVLIFLWPAWAVWAEREISQ